MRHLTFGIKVFSYAAVFAIFFSSCIKDGVEEIDGANLGIGDSLPSLDLTLSDGTQVNDATLSNKVSLIFFFSTSCPDCIEQFPVVEKLYREMKDEKNLIFCAVSRSQGEMMVSKYWADNDLTMPYSAQNDVHVYSLFARRTIPRIYIADKNNIIRAMYDDDPIADYASLRSDVQTYLNSGFD